MQTAQMLLPDTEKHLVYFQAIGDDQITIYESEELIWLEINGIVQSANEKAFPFRPSLPHCYLILLPLLIDKTPQHVLELGGGGLTLQRYINASHPNVDFTTVEINQTLVDIVNRYFPQSRPYQVEIDDAKTVISQIETQQFDWIIFDVFEGAEIPDGISLTASLSKMWRAVSDQGWLVLNSLEQDKNKMSMMLNALHQLSGKEPLVLKAQNYLNHVILMPKNNDFVYPEELQKENQFTALTQTSAEAQ